MAITFVQITNRPTLKRWRVTATLDADFEETVAHGMENVAGFDANDVIVMTEGVEGTTGDGVAALSLWEGEINPGNTSLIRVTKTNAAGSGSAGYQMELTAMLPHSLI